MTTPAPIIIYTDGSCSPNPGKGGYAAILTLRKSILEVSGGLPDTTNNVMELTAAIEGLKAIKTIGSRVIVRSDSQYLVNGATQWMDGWVRKVWREVRNADQWIEIYRLMGIHDISWEWVRGHSGDGMNAWADALANAARERQTRLAKCHELQPYTEVA